MVRRGSMIGGLGMSLCGRSRTVPGALSLRDFSELGRLAFLLFVLCACECLPGISIVLVVLTCEFPGGGGSE